MSRPRNLALVSHPVLMDTPPHPHHARDGQATLKTFQAIFRLNDKSHFVFNVQGAVQESVLRSLLRKGDIVILNTRLGMSDHREDALHKRVPLQHTWLEERIFLGWSKFFTYVSRKRVEMTDLGAESLANGHKKRRGQSFSTAKHAGYTDEGKHRTAGYIVWTRELWEDGPACLSLFGMSGETTLGLAAAIEERCPKELEFDFEDDYFLFVEMAASKDELVPDDVADWTSFWNSWELRVHRRGRSSPTVYPPSTPAPATPAPGAPRTSGAAAGSRWQSKGSTLFWLPEFCRQALTSPALMPGKLIGNE